MRAGTLLCDSLLENQVNYILNYKDACTSTYHLIMTHGMSLLSTALSTSRFVGQYIFFNKIGSVCFGGRRHSISISTFHSTVPVPASLCLLPGITTEFLTGTNQEQVSTTQNYCTALHCTALHFTALHYTKVCPEL